MGQSDFGAGRQKRVQLGTRIGMRMAWARLRQTLRLSSWFPQVPLAIAIGIAGLLRLWPAAGSVQELISLIPASSSGISELSDSFKALAIRGMPRELVGGLLMLVAVGLLLRSRLSWVLALLMTIASIALEVLSDSSFSKVLLGYSTVVLIALLLAHRSFHRTSLTVGTLFALIGVALTLGFGVLGGYALGKGFNPAITDFSSALYFTIITLSTVGYGDITPTTPEARLFTVSLVLLGLLVFATSLTTIVGPIFNKRLLSLLQPRKKRMDRKDHIIVAGNTPLAGNVVKSLRNRGLDVTAIWSVAPQPGVEVPEDLVVGDATNTSVLESAGVKQARAVLALLESDSDNAFVTLAAKDANPNLRTLLAVNDAHNMDRMRRVKPDAVFALPVIGAELVAMALSGEEIKTDLLLEQLLRLGGSRDTAAQS